MAPKATSNKSAAKKPDARKHAPPKATARPSATSAKAPPRKAQPAQVHVKSSAKPTASKSDQTSKAPAKKPVVQAKPMTQAKPTVAKPQAKAPIAAAKPASPRPTAKPTPPKAAVIAAQAGTHRVPATAPRQFGQQPAAALAVPKAAVTQKAMQTRQQPAPSKQAAAAAAVVAASKKPVSQRHGFKTNEWIVYPAHGVGRIVGIEEQEIAGMSLELFVITFEKDKMTLRVPTGKSASVGMRKLAEDGIVKRSMETLKGRARIKRTMWSRRAQEYEAKINSGDLVAIAEVVRDLYRSESQPEQSYSERQLYEAALDRMAREIAAVEKLDERGAVQRITEVLSKSAKGRRAAAEEAEVKAA